MNNDAPNLRSTRRKRLGKTQVKQRPMPGRRIFREFARWTIFSLAIASTVYGVVFLGNQFPFDVAQECITHTRLGLHIHPHLTIRINGIRRTIPTDIGIPSANCMRPVHTHDDTGKLHIEWTSPRDFTLGDFFRIWGQTFSENQILGYQADATHGITLTVNGKSNQEYERLILKDNDRIIIEYGVR